jgi:hypothetical protein
MWVDRETIVFSFIIGLLITLLSSLLINNVVIGEFPNIRFVSIPFIGMTYYGYPLPWMKQAVVPGTVKELILTHLILDVAYWTGFVALIIKVVYPDFAKKADKVIPLSRLLPAKKPEKKPPKRPKRRARKPKAKSRRRSLRRPRRR